MTPENPNSFPDSKALKSYTEEKGRGAIVVGHHNLENYPGMVRYLGLHFDVSKTEYDLDIEWISFGLDAFGENLLEGYLYRFGSLDELLAYLKNQYEIEVTDVSAYYQIETSQFPDPFKNADQKPLFEAAWERFQKDFASRLFLDEAMQLVHSTHDFESNE